MARARFTSEELFQQEVERLERERTQLLRERNFTQFMKRASRQITPSNRESQETDQATKKNQFQWRSSKEASIKNKDNPAVGQVKKMLEDIMKNGSRHGMDSRTSTAYLKNIQSKLINQLRSLTNQNIHSSPQIQKLKDLKLFIDKLIQNEDNPHKYGSGPAQKGYGSATENNKKKLEKIPQIPHPSIQNSGSNQQQSQISQTESNQERSSNVTSSVQESVQSFNQANLNFKKKQARQSRQLPIKKQSVSQKPVQVLQSIEFKLIREISHLRNQNVRLNKQLTQHQRRTPSCNTRRINQDRDETIINQLNPDTQNRQIKSIQQQNARLKNRVRTLEMQLLNWKSLRNIGSKNEMRVTQEKLYEQLQSKDQQITFLRKQTQKLSQYLQQSKQNVQSLRDQVKQLNNYIQKRNKTQTNKPQIFNNIRHIGDSERYVIRTMEHSGFRTPLVSQHTGFQNKTDVLNRNYSNFSNVKNQRNPQQIKYPTYQQKYREVQRAKTGHQRQYNMYHQDKIGEYRKLLNNLKSIKK